MLNGTTSTTRNLRSTRCRCPSHAGPAQRADHRDSHFGCLWLSSLPGRGYRREQTVCHWQLGTWRSRCRSRPFPSQMHHRMSPNSRIPMRYWQRKSWMACAWPVQEVRAAGKGSAAGSLAWTNSMTARIAKNGRNERVQLNGSVREQTNS